MTADLALSPSLASQLEEEPIENVWVWSLKDGTSWCWFDGEHWFMMLSLTARGITLVARGKTGWDAEFLAPIEDGAPMPARYPLDFPSAGLMDAYDGFILYDDQGKEIRRWVVR